MRIVSLLRAAIYVGWARGTKERQLMGSGSNIARWRSGGHGRIAMLASSLDDYVSSLVAAKLKRCACGPGDRTARDRGSAG